MPYDAKMFREWAENNRRLGKEAEHHARVREDVERENYPGVGYQLIELGTPVGLAAMVDLFNDRFDDGFSKLYRIWRYYAYKIFLTERRADWVLNQIDEGLEPSVDVPTLNMRYFSYAMTGALLFDEADYAHWLGKRGLFFYMKPDLRPLNLDAGPMIEYSLGLFCQWLIAQADSEDAAEELAPVLKTLQDECKRPYKGVLSGWNTKRFHGAFERLCDAFGDKHEQATPFNAIPIFILATRQIRRLQERDVPDHGLLEEPVCQFDKATLDRSDPFFDEVAEQVAAFAPTGDFRWPWN